MRLGVLQSLRAPGRGSTWADVCAQLGCCAPNGRGRVMAVSPLQGWWPRFAHWLRQTGSEAAGGPGVESERESANARVFGLDRVEMFCRLRVLLIAGLESERESTNARVFGLVPESAMQLARTHAPVSRTQAVRVQAVRAQAVRVQAVSGPCRNVLSLTCVLIAGRGIGVRVDELVGVWSGTRDRDATRAHSRASLHERRRRCRRCVCRRCGCRRCLDRVEMFCRLLVC